MSRRLLMLAAGALTAMLLMPVAGPGTAVDHAGDRWLESFAAWAEGFDGSMQRRKAAGETWDIDGGWRVRECPAAGLRCLGGGGR